LLPRQDSARSDSLDAARNFRAPGRKCPMSIASPPTHVV